MGSGSHSLIGSSWTSADGFRRSLRPSPSLIRRILPWSDFFVMHPGVTGGGLFGLLHSRFRIYAAAKKQAGSPFSITGKMPGFHPSRDAGATPAA